MEFCLSLSRLDSLESGSIPAERAIDPAFLIELAWHHRQRNVAHARELAARAHALLQSTPAGRERELCFARLNLVRGEQDWLSGHLDAAEAAACGALATCSRLHDDTGCADAHWLLAMIAIDRGQPEQRDSALAQVRRHAEAAGDLLRLRIASVAAMRPRVFADPRGVEAEFHRSMSAAEADASPPLAAWVNDLLGLAAANQSNFSAAIRHQLRTYEAAMDSGQVLRAIFATINLGVSFTNLGDNRSALEWFEKGTRLARDAGWPAATGMALMQTAEPLRLLGRHDAARAMLDEALSLLAPFERTHNYVIALLYLCDLQIDTGEYEAALSTIARIEARDEGRQAVGPSLMAQRGKAHALCQLGRGEEALAVATATLALSRMQGDAYNEIGTLQVLSDIHAMHRLPPPAGMTAPTARLHFLEMALQVARTIEGYTVPAERLEKLGRAHAEAGDTGHAYECLLQASELRQQAHHREAANRATAMQVWHETERTRIESEYHRRLAEAQASRAEVLQRTTSTLEALGAIGQEITRQLSAAAVLETIQRHVHSLLDAAYLSIYLMDEERQGLQPVLAMEEGRPVALRYIALDNPHSGAARCVRERQAIVIDVEDVANRASHLPGTLSTRTLMFAPLSAGDRVLGVMSVQSLAQHAYGERELLVFRTLCAYGAIALDNANAYQQLSRAREELLAKNGELEHAYRRLEEQSITDPLTGLRNRRFLTEQMDHDAALTQRRYDDWLQRGGPDPRDSDMVLFLIDLDHFKQVNDTYGHAAGDAVLMQLRARLERVFRDSDYLVRWGGEEFLVVARGARRADAALLAERLRVAVAGEPFAIGPDQALQRTCSIGFASFPFVPRAPRWLNWVQVVELADRALYLAKGSGRNRAIGVVPGDAPPLALSFAEVAARLPELLADGRLCTVSRMAAVL